MSHNDQDWIEHQRQRWLRPDWQRWMRHDAHRFAPPSVQEKCFAARRIAQRQAEEQAAADAAQDAFEREVLALRRDLAEIRLEYELRRFQQKYSPDQPRVPAGNPDGGQWTNGGEAGSIEESASDLEQNQGTALRTAPDQAPRDDLQQMEALANESSIRSQIDDAWAASNPSSQRPQEYGFWISRNEATGEIFTRPFASGGLTDSIQPGPTPDDAIAFFHTHPNAPDAGYEAGPSSADRLFANRRNLPGLLQSHNGMYYFGPSLRPVRLR